MRINCPDEEAGLLSYLQLYYCKLPKAKPIAFAILAIWLGLLFSTIGIAASDFFCVDLSTIAGILHMSESMAGVTFLAFGNGSPDVFSTFAAMKTHSGSLAIGELIGAAGFITSVVAGSMALVRPFKVARKSFIRDVGFFIIAASFSMVFLADGHLTLWECAAMVGFYVFYVIIVVVWHWYMKKKSRQRILENAARSHYTLPETGEEASEAYHDDDDAEVRNTSRMPSRAISAEDFSNLERGGSPFRRPLDEEVDADDATRDRYLAEISNNMRVSRPPRGERRPTATPIRPSLVGALEFRAVLSSLEKSRNIQPIPITLRRYSDDPALILSRPNHFSSPASIADVEQPPSDVGSGEQDADSNRGSGNRLRAKSTNDVSMQDPTNRQISPLPQIDLLDAGDSKSSNDASSDIHPGAGEERRPRIDTSLPSTLTVPQDRDSFGYLSSSPVALSPRLGPSSENLLAPPGNADFGILDRPHRTPQSGSSSISNIASVHRTSNQNLSRLDIPNSTGSSPRLSPIVPFPAYYDDPNFVPTSPRPPSLALPSASTSPESAFGHLLYTSAENKPLRWWPYKVLPSPQTIACTLFPTLYAWSDKNVWEKMLGVVAAPSVFLLAITLPVVEADKEEGESYLDPNLDEMLTPHLSRQGTDPAPRVVLPPDSPSMTPQNGTLNGGLALHDSESPVINITPSEDTNAASQAKGDPNNRVQASESSPGSIPPPSSLKEWNRWLIIVQIFTGPMFILLILHLNTRSEDTKAPVIPILCTLIGSLTVSVILLLFTSPERPPRYRYLLCFVGFVVSIAWISTIAGEVVGVLKAFGIIMNISDAILGLTIFAVGNSLGDLVADITVARLGFPVMALSACFGGPMLNILLGIGLSGLYMTIHGGEKRHRKHPDQPIKYKPYAIEVGGTLMISGIALLVTLVGLLIVVPLRGWRMDRKVGIGLIALWTVSTMVNVIVEIVGVSMDK